MRYQTKRSSTQFAHGNGPSGYVLKLGGLEAKLGKILKPVDIVVRFKKTAIAALSLVCTAVSGLTSAPANAAMTDVEWNNFMRSASNALDANQYWIAEPALKKSVSEAELFGFNDLRLARALSELGRYYCVRGRFDLAQPFLEREFAVREIAYGKDDGRMIQPMGSLIRFYLTSGTASKAEPLTEDLLAFVEGKISESHFQNEKKSTLQEGQPLSGYAGTAAPAMRDPLLEWSIVCDNLANLYRSQKKYEYAERLYKDALDIKSTVLGKGHLSLANSYDSLGALAMETEDYKEAEGYFRDALSTTENTLSTEYPEVYSRLDKLAKCLIKEGKFSDAEALYVRAMTTFWKKEPSRGGDESRCMFAMGCMYLAEKRYSAAAPYLSRALRSAEKFSGPNSLGLVTYLQMYAYDLYYLGRRGETAALRARANFITGPAEKVETAMKEKEKQKELEASDQKDSKNLALATELVTKFSKKTGKSSKSSGRKRRRR